MTITFDLILVYPAGYQNEVMSHSKFVLLLGMIFTDYLTPTAQL